MALVNTNRRTQLLLGFDPGPAGLRLAAENCLRALRGEKMRNLITKADRYL